MLRMAGRWLVRFLSKPRAGYASPATVDGSRLAATLRQGDVLLVEGNSRFSEAIKYLTQSTWSHAAMYVGDAVAVPDSDERHWLVEADVRDGVRLVPLAHYAEMHTRICRPERLAGEDLTALINYMANRLGHQYDVRNIIDLARYLIQKPPVPGRLRRRLVALGSGDPTRAICSSLIAQAFQSIRYPILPHVDAPDSQSDARDEQWHIRHHSLFAPRDFDISPYFRVIKATLEQGFDYRQLAWSDDAAPPREEKLAVSRSALPAYVGGTENDRNHNQRETKS